ncbi:hypothetical protein BGAL_0027g00130 [Botrytis galanthina]|uniref:O-methyltransferase C-terminal domain-containing protein n=1 Tax=Botrytis galanthina TaxID=278940 RepID=A0A4S8RB95_9HELO|nr:hypothetical protein BGAL_0027g00130 [Botrytis galanthina]
MSNYSRLSDLAAQVRASTATIDRYLKDHNLPDPSFHEDEVYLSLVGDAESTQTIIVDEYLQSHGIASPSFDVNYSETPQIPKEISASKNIIFEATEELNSLMGGPVGVLTSMNITILPTFHAIYRWKLASSFPLDGEASSTEIADTVGIPEADIQRIIHEIWPAFTRMVDAIEKWTDSQEPNETGYNLATNQFDTYFEGMKKITHRKKRFADVMTFFHAGGKWERAGLIEHYNWEIMSEGLVVKLGGSQGAMCIDLARHYSKMNCISQDLPDVVEGVETPEDVKGRVEIVAHDFFMEQPVKGPDAYLFRGSDFTMKSCLNGRERDADEWAQLFEKADSRFKFQGIAAVPSSRFSVIEAIWEDDSAPGL